MHVSGGPIFLGNRGYILKHIIHDLEHLTIHLLSLSVSNIHSLSPCDGVYEQLSGAPMIHIDVLGGWVDGFSTIIYVGHVATNGCLLLGVISY